MSGAVTNFDDLPRGHFGAILADPPWQFKTWSENGGDRAPEYGTMDAKQLVRLPVEDFAAKDCVLFCWATWPHLKTALWLISAWGFTFKTCAFSWMKADPYRLFADDATPFAGMGFWTRANTEPCLLATRGKPKRLNADVRQGIIAPRREHSRKPDCIHERIERLVAGPYLELFARQSLPGWTTWGNEATKFDRPEAMDDFAKSLDVAYSAVRERVANGGERGFMDEPEPARDQVMGAGR